MIGSQRGVAFQPSVKSTFVYNWRVMHLADHDLFDLSFEMWDLDLELFSQDSCVTSETITLSNR